MAAFFEDFCQHLPNEALANKDFLMPTTDESLLDYLTSSVLSAEFIVDAAAPPQPVVVCPVQLPSQPQKRPREEDLGEDDFQTCKFLALYDEGDENSILSSHYVRKCSNTIFRT